LLPQGRVVTECPLSTADGVKAVDVAWLAPDRRQEVRSLICLIKAPEICVEVLSPSNTPDEITEKIALYFETGAKEVWICDHGTLQFHFPTIPKIRPLSGMCPPFPPQIDI
jgi:Uma2 family endonuclease